MFSVFVLVSVLHFYSSVQFDASVFSDIAEEGTLSTQNGNNVSNYHSLITFCLYHEYFAEV